LNVWQYRIALVKESAARCASVLQAFARTECVSVAEWYRTGRKKSDNRAGVGSSPLCHQDYFLSFFFFSDKSLFYFIHFTLLKIEFDPLTLNYMACKMTAYQREFSRTFDFFNVKNLSF